MAPELQLTLEKGTLLEVEHQSTLMELSHEGVRIPKMLFRHRRKNYDIINVLAADLLSKLPQDHLH